MTLLEEPRTEFSLDGLITEVVDALDVYDTDAAVEAIVLRLTDEQLRALVPSLLRPRVRHVVGRAKRDAFDSYSESHSPRWTQVRENQDDIELMRVLITLPGMPAKRLGDCHRPDLVLHRDLLKAHADATNARAAQIDRLVKLLRDNKTPVSKLGAKRVREALS